MQLLFINVFFFLLKKGAHLLLTNWNSFYFLLFGQMLNTFTNKNNQILSTILITKEPQRATYKKLDTNKKGDEKRFATVSALAIRSIVPASWSAKEGEMKKAHQPCLRSRVYVRTASSASKAFGAFSQQETKMLFSQTWSLRSSPSSGTCLSSIGIFHLRLQSLFWSFFNYWWCSEWNVRGICKVESGCEGWGRGR